VSNCFTLDFAAVFLSSFLLFVALLKTKKIVVEVLL
jgi:hypothetical protein